MQRGPRRALTATNLYSTETLSRLLEAAGFALDVGLRPIGLELSHMLEDVPRILRLTLKQRLTELRNASRGWRRDDAVPDAASQDVVIIREILHRRG